MTEAEHLDLTRRRYDAMSMEYAEFVRTAMVKEHFARAMLLAFAGLVGESSSRAVVDVGCGPGHISDLLADTGLAVRGIDLSPAMVQIARARRPDLRFDVGSLLSLDLPDAQFDGVLAHFSIIHTPPAEVPTALAEFVRVLKPGGYVLVSFQSGDDDLESWAAFDHRVTQAYRWSIGAMVHLLNDAGFVECARLWEVPAPHQRFHAGHVLARKPLDAAPGEP